MKRIIVLALVLVVFMFASTIATTAISIPKTSILDRTFSIKNVVPFGDPIGGGPPGVLNGTGG